MRNESGRNGSVAAAVLLFTVVFAAACQPGDGRGYTRDPLERTGVISRAEQRSPVAALGQPNYTRADAIDLPEEPTAVEEPAIAEPVDLPAGVTQDMVAAGRELFEGGGNCFSCHGMNAGGGPLGPDLRDGSWIHIDGSLDAIAEIIAAGVMQPQQYPAAMPPMGGAQLSVDQVRQIAAYLYALNPR
jgi:mono/diheme cytochrome c family protein